MEDFLMYALSTIGMCHIIVDSSLFIMPREIFKKSFEILRMPKIGEIVDCYICCGTWCGFLMGFVWMEKTYDLQNFMQIFACGCAGGFMSNVAAMTLNWIEASTIVNMPDGN